MNNRCTNCGYPIEEGDKFCPECGSQIIDARFTPKNHTKKKKKHFSLGKIITLVVICALVIWGKLKYDAYNYGINLHNMVYYAMQSAEHLDSAGVQFINVWNNSVYQIVDEKTDKFTRDNNGTGEFFPDFNTALDLVMSDKDYQAEIQEAIDAKNTASDLMGKLTNPPKSYEDAYRDAKTFYADYMAFFNAVVYPNGNLIDYSGSFNEIRDKVLKSSYSLSMY